MLLWTPARTCAQIRIRRPRPGGGGQRDGAGCRPRPGDVAVKSSSLGDMEHSLWRAESRPESPRGPQSRAGPGRVRDPGCVSGMSGAPSSAEEPCWSHRDANGSTQPPPRPRHLFPCSPKATASEDTPRAGAVAAPPLYAALALPRGSKRRARGGARRRWGRRGQSRGRAGRGVWGKGRRRDADLYLCSPARLPRPWPRREASLASPPRLSSRRARPGLRPAPRVPAPQG